MKKLIVAGAVSLIMTTSLMMSASTTFAHTGKGNINASDNACYGKHDNWQKSSSTKCHKHESIQGSGCEKNWKNQPKGDCDET